MALYTSLSALSSGSAFGLVAVDLYAMWSLHVPNRATLTLLGAGRKTSTGGKVYNSDKSSLPRIQFQLLIAPLCCVSSFALDPCSVCMRANVPFVGPFACGIADIFASSMRLIYYRVANRYIHSRKANGSAILESVMCTTRQFMSSIPQAMPTSDAEQIQTPSFRPLPLLLYVQ